MSTSLKATLSSFLLLLSAAQAQQTTTTNCSTYGNNTNCTSTTTDNTAQQRQAYQAGQQIGSALGNGMALAMQSHSKNRWVKKFCAGHPGESWNWTRNSDGALLDSGRCETDDDKALAAVNQFMNHHRDYIKDQQNSDTMIAYLEAHNLDPRQQRAYEKAYEDLKKEGKLGLYRN